MQLLTEPFTCELAPVLPDILTHTVYAPTEPLAFVDLTVAPNKLSPTLLATSEELSFVVSVVLGNHKLAKPVHFIFLEHARELKPLAVVVYLSEPTSSICFVVIPLSNEDVAVAVLKPA